MIIEFLPGIPTDGLTAKQHTRLRNQVRDLVNTRLDERRNSMTE